MWSRGNNACKSNRWRDPLPLWRPVVFPKQLEWTSIEFHLMQGPGMHAPNSQIGSCHRTAVPFDKQAYADLLWYRRWAWGRENQVTLCKGLSIRRTYPRRLNEERCLWQFCCIPTVSQTPSAFTVGILSEVSGSGKFRKYWKYLRLLALSPLKRGFSWRSEWWESGFL